MKNHDTYEKWIEAGYAHFARVGPDGFSIKELSEIAGLSRTSFNYYFDGKEEFFDILLEHHMNVVDTFGKKAMSKKSNPTQGLALTMEKMQTGVMFHIQLFNNRKDDKFNKAYLKGHELNYKNGILDWFTDFFELTLNREEAKRAYLLFVDVLNTRFNILLRQPLNPSGFTPVFFEVINDFKLLLRSYNGRKN